MKFPMYDAQQALSFLVQQAASIESQVYEIEYPEVDYASLVPVDTSANEWARTITFFSMDKVGQADWFHHEANDVPRADVTKSQHEHGIEMAAIGYGYTIQEIQQAMMVPGTNLTSDRADAARRAYEEFMYTLTFEGNTARDMTGLFNDANVTASYAANTGTGSSTNFADKTGTLILSEVNALLTGIYTSSNTVEMADTILLPVAVYADIATRQNTTSSDLTILEYLMRSNVYSAMTDQPLTVRAHRGLSDAGTGSTGRMVAYKRDPKVLKLHLPMPHRFLPVWQTGPLRFDVPGIFRTGGLEIRRPGAVRYLDGVSGDVTS